MGVPLIRTLDRLGVPIGDRMELARQLRRYLGLTIAAATVDDLDLASNLCRIEVGALEARTARMTALADQYDRAVGAGLYAAERWANGGAS